ncbi:MAG: serine--tRNA ligase [Patescibacteria group bacterium]
MLDIKYIREHVNEIKENCEKRRVVVDVDKLLGLDKEQRDLRQQIDTLRAERNKKSRGKPTPEEIDKMKTVGGEIAKLEKEFSEGEGEFTALMYGLPNLTHPDVPAGKDESENQVVRKVGEPTTFSFQPKEHYELGEALGMIDIERAAKVTGSRFGYLKGDIARLEFALIQHALSVVTDERVLQEIIAKKNLTVPAKPFTPVVPPVMIRPDVMHRMGRLEPKEERYHIPSDDLYLVGSAEHTLGPMHMDETLTEADLPLRYIGFSTAFRREAGSYGKDTKGILRVHQFDKLEIESFTFPEHGEAEQDFIIAIQEYLMQSLGIPYQVIFNCTGDMGAPDYRQFDIESWLPGQNRYRETHTSDYMTDFQSRRLNIRVRRKNDETEFVHMNDATTFAIGRTLIAIMENYQEQDGTIRIPDVLQQYMSGKTVIQ